MSYPTAGRQGAPTRAVSELSLIFFPTVDAPNGKTSSALPKFTLGTGKQCGLSEPCQVRASLHGGAGPPIPGGIPEGPSEIQPVSMVEPEVRNLELHKQRETGGTLSLTNAEDFFVMT